MPPGFGFPDRSDIWMPLRLNAEGWSDREGHYLRTIARLGSGIPLSTLQSELQVLNQAQAAEHRANAGWSSSAVSTSDLAARHLRIPVAILLLCGALILVVTVVNTAALLVGRLAARRSELWTRRCLGASTKNLLAAITAENALIVAAAWLIGMAISSSLGKGLTAMVPGVSDAWHTLGASPWTAALGLLLAAIGAALLAAAALVGLKGTLREKARPKLRLLSALTATQIGASVLLLLLGWSLLQSHRTLSQRDPGFEADGVVVVDVELSGAAYEDVAARTLFVESAVRELEKTPGVETPAVTSTLPIGGGSNYIQFRAPGKGPDELDYSLHYATTPRYLDTLGIRITSGRPLASSDALDSTESILISETLARRLFPTSNPLGQELALLTGLGSTSVRIVGVATDVHASSLAAPEFGAIYSHYSKAPARSLTLCFRSTEPEAVASDAVAAISSVDSELALGGVRLLADVLRDSLAGQRLIALAMLALSIFALVMATISLYAVISQWYEGTLYERAVRNALGATPARQLRDAVRVTAAPSAVGLIAGSLAAAAGAQALASLVPGIGPLNPLSVVLVAAGLFGIASLVSRIVAKPIEDSLTEHLRGPNA